MSSQPISTELLEERMLFGQLARHELIPFAQLNTPQPADPFNARLSRFTWLPHHHFIASALQRLAGGLINRLEIELPPRYGKSELSVRQFVTWWMAKNRGKSVIVVTHTDTLAQEHGRDCRENFQGPGYKLTFGAKEQQLRNDSKAADRLQLQGGGVVTFSGRGGLGAGVGADLMIFDDFFKNSQEAESKTVRDEAWRTFISDCQTRLNNDHVPVVMIGSRRHEDDVQGRLFDKTSPHYDETEAKRWVRIRLPALAEAGDPLGRAIDDVMWPARFTKDFYLKKRNHASDIVRMDFQTQDQCNPVASEGNYFKKHWLATYKPDELPQHLRFYGASDHAYRTGQKNDRNCLLIAGVDATDTIWIMPTSWWERSETDVMVEQMISLMARHNTVTWWAARDAISGSVGPFLRKRQLERRVFNVVDDSIREDKDLQRRAQSIRNRMAMGLVRFPVYWPKWGEAESELLAFPNGKHDDLIAALSILGMGLDKMSKATAPIDTSIKRGTWAWHTHGQEQRQAVSLKGW